jgi:hypothetical protein
MGKNVKGGIGDGADGGQNGQNLGQNGQNLGQNSQQNPQHIQAGYQPSTVPPKYSQNEHGLTNKIAPFHLGPNNMFNPSSTQPPPQPFNTIAKPNLWHRFKRLSPILDQAPMHLRHLWRVAKQIKSEESLLLFQAEAKQAKNVLFSDINLKRTKLEISQRLKFAEQYVDRKLREPYIEPTTEYRLQQKEVLHDKIIDMHYAQDRLIDKLRQKVTIFSGTIEAINTDPRKREILARKVFFTSLDDDKLISKIVKIIYFPFGLVLRSVVSAGCFGLFSIELLTSKLVPELALLARTLRNNIQSYTLTPSNILQLMGLMLLATFVATVGHDIIAIYTQSVTTPRGAYVDVANTFLFVNSEEMIYDAVREMVANRLLITPETYSEMYSPYGTSYFRMGKLRNDVGPNDVPMANQWGSADRTSKQLSLIQPIFTQMKQDLIGLYKDRFYLPLERLTDGLRNHNVSMGFTVEALDGFLDAMYMRDTRTRLDNGTGGDAHNKVINYLLHEDFLVLPPGDAIRTQAPGEIYYHMVSNFRSLEAKDSTMGGELFKDYVKLGSRVAYRKKLLHEIEMLTEVRKLLENARFPHITIPVRDIKKIACDLNDPVTKAVMGHIDELRLADGTTPLYPNRVARQLLESSYQIDSRHSHYSKDSTIVNDHYLTLCNMDNPRYTYDALCNHRNLQFESGDQRDVFERHIYHLGMVLNKLDAILVQNYLELRHIEHHVINPLNPLEGNVIGLFAKDEDLKKLSLPKLQDVMNQAYTLPLDPLDNGSGDSTFHMSKWSRHTDPIEYDRLNYQNLISERTRELKKQLDLDLLPNGHPNQDNPNSLSAMVGQWWYGKNGNNSTQLSSMTPFSEEFESVLHWQATRDVMATINNDPYLHRRFMADFGAERHVDMLKMGYLSPSALDPKYIEGVVNMTSGEVSNGREFGGSGSSAGNNQSSSSLSFAQTLFAPVNHQDIPATIDYGNQHGRGGRQ